MDPNPGAKTQRPPVRLRAPRGIDAPSRDQRLQIRNGNSHAQSFLSVKTAVAAIPRNRIWQWTLLVFVTSFALIFSRSMHARVDVDEHPFIASAALMARHGLLPYRDYHYNHMPTEMIIYAALFRASGHLLLAARCFQVTCAAFAVAALFYIAYASFKELHGRARLVAAGAIAALLLLHPLFIKTAGLSWNHDFPLLMSLLGFVALRRGMRAAHGEPTIALAGFLLGLSMTSRLTFAAAGPGFLFMIALYPGLTLRRKTALLAVFAAGFVLASAPAAWVWAQSPRNAWFGNFVYPRLNTAIHALRDEHKRFTFGPILLYYIRSLLFPPGNGIVTAAFVWLVALVLMCRARTDTQLRVELLSLVAVVVCLIASGFMPAPPYPQYFYAACPFMILGIVWCLAAMPAVLQQRPFRQLSLLGICVMGGFAIGFYNGVAFVFNPHKWTPMQVHSIGQEIAAGVNTPTVLTLEPAYALEGGLDIDERLTTCRFGLRVADLLSPQERAQYLMPSPSELPAILRQRHAAVLIVRGTDRRLDDALIQAAGQAHYEKVPLARGGAVWRPPVH